MKKMYPIFFLVLTVLVWGSCSSSAGGDDTLFDITQFILDMENASGRDIILVKGSVSPSDFSLIHDAMLSETKKIILDFTNTGIIEIPDAGFHYLENLKGIILPDTVKIIGERAFDGCNNLEEFETPDKTSRIGSFAFRNCSSLKSITIPENVATLGSGTFILCTQLSDVKILCDISKIPFALFQQCRELKNIIIPASVTQIETYAFYGCSQLTTIIIEAEDPPALVGADNWFANSKIYVPDNSVEAYESEWRSSIGSLSILPKSYVPITP